MKLKSIKQCKYTDFAYVVTVSGGIDEKVVIEYRFLDTLISDDADYSKCACFTSIGTSGTVADLNRMCDFAFEQFKQHIVKLKETARLIPNLDEDDIMQIEALRLDDARYEMQQERAFEQEQRNEAHDEYDQE